MRCTIKKGIILKFLTAPLIFCLISSAYAVEELDLFGESFAPSYDIKIKALDYVKNDEAGQPSGNFSFDKFKVITNDASIDLNNSSGFYDADIYISNNLVGFKGEAARFVYRMAEEDFKYVSSFRWMKMANLHFLMDREQIVLNGHRFAIQEPRTYFVAQSFDLNCGRHPEFLLNNGDGFLAGCLNFSNARSLQGEGFGIDYRLSDEEDKKIVDIQGYFTDFKATQEDFSASALNFSAIFQDDTDLSITDLDFSCGKKRDLVSIDEESLLVPCLSEFAVSASQIDLKMASENDKVIVSAAEITNDKEKIKTKFNRLIYSGETSSFSLREGTVICDQAVGDKKEVGSYVEGCLDAMEITANRSDQSSSFNLVMDEKKVGEEFYLTLNGDLKTLRTQSEKIHIKSQLTTLNIDHYLSLSLMNVDWKCQKKKEMRSFELVEMLDYCKLGSELQIGKIKILDKENTTEPIVASITPRSVMTGNGKVQAHLSSVHLADREDLTLIKDLFIDCEVEKNGDIFQPNDLISGCVKNSRIEIPVIFSQDSDLNANSLLDSNFQVERMRILENHPSMSDVKIVITNGVIDIDLKVRALGGEKKVSFSGPIHWDKEKNLLSIQVQKSKLPLGIKSKAIFMMVLKKFLVSEMVTVPSKNVINIQL
jgi:hypothetical protein